MIKKLYISIRHSEKLALKIKKNNKQFQQIYFITILSRNYLSRYMIRECRSVFNSSDQHQDAKFLHLEFFFCVFNVY